MRIALSADIAAPPAAVWHALTDGEARAGWWRDGIVLEPWPGGAFAEPWRDGDGSLQLTRGHVLMHLPPWLLDLSWRDNDWPAATRVRFALSPTGTGCRLALTHDGWTALAAGDELVVAHKAGWRQHLDRLRVHVEGGEKPRDGRV